MKKIFKPNYNHSIINIPATILEYAGVKNDYPKSAILKKELRKNYKNIVFIILDGMGSSIIKKLLPKDNIFNTNVKETLHSVFPPTTTAATTTYLTCKYPSEHGWLGWNMYFEELGTVLDLFSGKMSISQEDTAYPNFVSKALPRVDTILDKIASKDKFEVASIYPDTVPGVYTKNYSYKSIKDMCAKIRRALQSPTRKFLYCYNESPDDIMHEYGTSAKEAKTFMENVSGCIEKLVEECTDTLFIISADHGQIDVRNRIFLHEYEDVCALFSAPPSLDSRTMSFRIKEHEKVTFYNLFNKYFGNEFVLFTKKTILKKKLFGPKTALLDKYIGDFVAIAVGGSILQYKPHKTNDEIFAYKGHHAGLTKEEVEVPLIMIGKK
ncbi:MAG: hypothetical protein E7361_03925 [Clostridiales bacterium]|nr:hypothetical protein [Clostridiales bacterium]